jgi:uncharacterized protein YcbX
MPRVVALYRYPVKSLTPEVCDVLSILGSGRVVGDRVLGIRFANTEAPDDTWSRKTGMVALVNTPGLTRLNVRFDSNAQRLTIYLGGETLADEVLDADGRKRIAMAVADYVLNLKENPLAGHPERLPLRVVGDGITPRYHDSTAGRVTLLARESILAVEAAFGNAKVSELRFRANVAIEGVKAWEEQGWVGRKVRIGTVEFDVVKGVPRCLATHANPETGEQDLPILTTLTKVIGQETPTFAVGMLPANGSGEIRVGDEVIVID